MPAQPALTVAVPLALVAAAAILAPPAKAQPEEAFMPITLSAWLRGLDYGPWLFGGLVCLILIGVAHHRIRAHRRAVRLETSGLTNGARFRLVDAVCHAVWRGRMIDDARLQRALEVARDTTDMDYGVDHIRELAHRADRLILPWTFRWMRVGLNQSEKLVIFNAVTSVMLSSGRLSLGDQRLLRTLSHGLGLKASDLRDLARLFKG